MASQTEKTITDPDVLVAQLAVIRSQGYALDDNEQEVGVRCVAVSVADAPGRVAISVSGPQARMGEDQIARMVPVLQTVAAVLGAAAGEYQ